MKRRRSDKNKRQSIEPLSATGRAWVSDLLWGLALTIVVLLAYQPAWHGGFLADDSLLVQRRDLHSWHGLYRIWFDVRATLQYYPVLHTVLWLQHPFWGDDPFGYHVVNILLHVAAALLVAVILRRLEIPAAYLAAAVFALHPVQVESVAWIAEMKNTLSAVFYLAAALVYLRFDQSRKAARYWVAFALFLLSLLSKTVACTWPAAMLILLWWRRGQLSRRRDILPLAPFFLVGLAGGAFVAKMERTEWGGSEVALDWTLAHRFLLGGRAIWFYVGKLFWPSPLVLGYPRWEIRPEAWWQYIFPVAVLLALVAAWFVRRRGRGPLAAMLFFGGVLFPFLGVVNCGWFAISYVADHFQYLACLGVIVPVCAGLALLLRNCSVAQRRGGYALCAAVLVLLTTLTWRQSRAYVNLESLNRATLAVNPSSPWALSGLGNVMLDKGRIAEANDLFQAAVRADPACSAGHFGLGVVCAQKGQLDEAIVCFQKSLDFEPKNVGAHMQIAKIQVSRGKIDEAIAHYRSALEIEPEYSFARVELGLLLAHYETALQLNPRFVLARRRLADLMYRRHSDVGN